MIQRNGGELAQTQRSADLLLTSLKSSSRIKRHLKNRQVPIADIRWLKDCVKEKELLPLDKYSIPVDDVSSRSTHDTSSTDSQGGSGDDKQSHANKGNDINKQSHTSKDSSNENKRDSDNYYLPKSSDILTKEFANAEPDVLSYEDTDSSNDESNSNDDGDSDDIDPNYNNTRYECLRPTPLRSKHNGKLVAYLRLLEKARELETNDKSALAYRHAISAIKAYPRKIQSEDEAGKIKGIGSKIKELTRIYLETGKVPEAEALLSDEEFRTLDLFNKCFGVGPATGKAWWDMGYRTLQQVLDHGTLSNTVRLGIQLLPDFIIPMKRSDVEELIDIVETQAASVNDQLLVTPVGGYRRGKQQSGDLDIVISSKQEIDMSDILLSMIDRLKSQGYIKHVLWKSRIGPSTKQDRLHKQRAADTDDNEDQVISKSFRRSGFDELPKAFTCFMQPSTGISRQVDLIIASFEEYPTAVLGWTGSRQFERSIRDYAKKEKNIKLSSHQMITRSMPERRISVTNEKDIFDALDIPFISPQNRNC
ncbi:hypothetical protein BCR42DRAFT_411740 [Absidia repens]|uniref:DNA polymerase lambda n=1 Tax=Absidia repens TaxID=90262 RepID=A0A1X2IM56_9FUNG|nr:hypothetical protein BCR42DRAFT_411740 [Absidia repens]